ncbi:hypothetical protein EXQ31_13340 [Clostridium botulinum]|uniref:Uncharacterized protein n=1 Tax=Clostridium botulinum (strain 657 / Type Ba4) TaxID=515621 RepID=A0A3F2ZPR4_CLOB6|nr:DUF5697 family protein [Clostridium botulinum]ACQ51154.1 hypothetical protein CLJ_0255 [Clostridium botulinum Ba4 str. 657]AXG90378.1 hypothetical protein AGE29_00780 [Clostridium botulinum]MBO0525035.1 hypothetical protein [Clostridium botulinum]MBO0527036.1 hypothetical protein [Clostridium botulinum]MBO0532450.1 hypothetical protein [Clostridium botulinum]
MSGLLRRELEVRNFVNQLGFATKDQIIKLMNLEGKHTQIPDILVTKNALKTDFFQGQTVYTNIFNFNRNLNVVPCVELLKHFSGKFNWFMVENFPFYLCMYMNNKIFDVTYIPKGDENIISSYLNKLLNPIFLDNMPELPQNIIVILESSDMLSKVKINCPNILYAVIDITNMDNTIQFLNAANM